MNTDNSYVNRELSIYVNAPVKAHHETWPATPAEIAKVKKVDIAYGAVAQYHVNPSAADLEGATIGFYDHSAPTYTRGDAAPSINPVAKEATFAKDGKYNKFENGILTVPFTVNYGEDIKKWSHQDMTDIFYDDAPMIGEIILETIRNVDAGERKCECLGLRKETLLKDVYNQESAKG